MAGLGDDGFEVVEGGAHAGDEDTERNLVLRRGVGVSGVDVAVALCDENVVDGEGFPAGVTLEHGEHLGMQSVVLLTHRGRRGTVGYALVVVEKGLDDRSRTLAGVLRRRLALATKNFGSEEVGVVALVAPACDVDA